jgi:hypothetical protein
MLPERDYLCFLLLPTYRKRPLTESMVDTILSEKALGNGEQRMRLFLRGKMALAESLIEPVCDALFTRRASWYEEN